MSLLLDPDYDVATHTCDCGSLHERVTGFVNHEVTGAFAIFYADCVHHGGEHEAYIDVILDDQFDPDSPTTVVGDRVTFSCRYGFIEGHGYACSLVTPPGDCSNALRGAQLSREEALQHEWLPRFWDVVDLIIEKDPTVRKHFGLDPQ
ncbi:hypothetical protein ACFWEJ_08265 [Promicromonospora sp. NPDC060204]|uniref:hypothetical protein n=1 Tax=Promicromonospora sp. NPDC060204 TaxID=3347071 RepID=UPI0036556187